MSSTESDSAKNDSTRPGAVRRAVLLVLGLVRDIAVHWMVGWITGDGGWSEGVISVAGRVAAWASVCADWVAYVQVDAFWDPGLGSCLWVVRAVVMVAAMLWSRRSG